MTDVAKPRHQWEQSWPLSTQLSHLLPDSKLERPGLRCPWRAPEGGCTGGGARAVTVVSLRRCSSAVSRAGQPRWRTLPWGPSVWE